MELFSGLVNCSAHSYNESAQQLQSVANKCAHFALVQNQAKQAQRCFGSRSMSCGKRFLIYEKLQMNVKAILLFLFFCT